MRRSDFEKRRTGDYAKPSSAEEPEIDELPRGALLITLTYLLLLTMLWLQVYLQLLSTGGIPQQ